VPEKDESGASLVEFALVLPVFMMLLLGMFTGGLAYSRKLSVGQAVREGARYGATKPFTGTTPNDAWLREVADLTVASGDGELNVGQQGRYVCVAYISGSTSGSPTARSLSVTQNQSTGAATGTLGGFCKADTRTEPRIQVVAQRTSKLEMVLLPSPTLTLSSEAVARFEAT
jgi:Flp pilus assembly protein TadG